MIEQELYYQLPGSCLLMKVLEMNEGEIIKNPREIRKEK